MKGLLIKDFRLLKGQVHFLLIVTVCVIVFMINGNEAFGVAYVCSMVALLSLTTVSYDEYENGSAFLFTLPITKKDYVKEKYLFAGILLLIGLIVSMIMWYITAVIKTGNIAWDDWMSCCIGGVTAGLMMTSGTVKVWTRKRKNCVSYNSVIGCCVRNIDARIHERNKVCTECKAYIESDG